MGILSAPLMGCSGDPAPGGKTGTQLNGPAAYTVLTGADATAGTTPAPAAWPAKGPCLTCHGPAGAGVQLIAGDPTTILGPEVRHTPVTYATWVIRHGGRTGSGMVAFAEAPAAGQSDLSPTELTEIVTWLGAQPKPTTGDGLYRDFCGNCHGPVTPSGGAVPVSIIGLPAATISQNVRMGVGTDPAMRNDYMPAYDVAALTDAELGLIQTFLMAK
jgi:mono/diheme cytochrome c family protein